jgi:Helix-turn-helix family
VIDDGDQAAAALVAHKTWRTVEPLHGMIYFVPEAAEAYARLGITGTAGYFASRAAPMGAVGADVVIATFFNFNPELVRRAIPDAWQKATPAELIAARFRAVDAACRRILGNEVVESPDMVRAAALARIAAEQAARHVEGRPLAAGHADVDWPDEPHLQLWHAQSILREFRGDGHVALLVIHGLSGLEALVTHAAAGDVPARILLATRAWSDEDWQRAVDDLRQRGWLEPGDELRFTASGARQRREIEDGTDALSSAPYRALGEEGCTELRTLVRPWSKVFAEHLR